MKTEYRRAARAKQFARCHMNDLSTFDPATCMVKVGEASPGSMAGDIWVSENLIAQKVIEPVRELVRDEYRVAYESQRKHGDKHG